MVNIFTMDGVVCAYADFPITRAGVESAAKDGSVWRCRERTCLGLLMALV